MQLTARNGETGILRISFGHGDEAKTVDVPRILKTSIGRGDSALGIDGERFGSPVGIRGDEVYSGAENLPERGEVDKSGVVFYTGVTKIEALYPQDLTYDDLAKGGGPDPDPTASEHRTFAVFNQNGEIDDYAVGVAPGYVILGYKDFKFPDGVAGYVSEKEQKILDRIAAESEAPIERKTTAVSAEVADMLKDINLSREGYENFVSKLDDEYIESIKRSYSWSFDERKNGLSKYDDVPITQVMWHFTAASYDRDPTREETWGDMFNLTHFLNAFTPENEVGANGYIDHSGYSYLLTQLETRVNHAIGRSANSVGIETEAVRQKDITPEQYESLLYFTVYYIKELGLLEKNRYLDNVVMGHAEQQSIDGIDNREDFHSGESAILRWFLAGLLNQMGMLPDSELERLTNIAQRVEIREELKLAA
jgi:hypothetical protein